MSIQTFLLFLATWSLVAFSPGPAVMYSLLLGSRHGFRTSWIGICGIQLANLILFVGFALGLGALSAKAEIAITVLRYVGAICLGFFGFRFIYRTFQRPAVEVTPTLTTPAPHSLFLQGLFIELTNPKTLLFVSALLPQFTDPHHSASLQLTIFTVTAVVVQTLSLTLYAFLAQRGAQSQRFSRWRVWPERVFGGALILFGFRLLLAAK